MDEETRRNWEIIAAPPGPGWSGRARYAAAMFFCQRGEMAPEVLEVYRICSRLDAEDPLSIIRQRGIGKHWLQRMGD